MSDTPFLDKFNKGEFEFSKLPLQKSIGEMEKEEKEWNEICLKVLHSIPENEENLHIIEPNTKYKGYCICNPKWNLKNLIVTHNKISEMRVCISDIDTALYLVCYNKKDNPSKSLEDCCKQMDELLTNIFEVTGSTHYILYLTIGRNFRYEIDSTYKEARKKQEKPPFFYEVRQYLIDKYGAISHDNFESDDLCVTTRKLLLKQGLNCFIASPDKDIKMLEGETFDYKKFEWKVTSKEEAFYYFWSSMVTGDSSDGIKGLPGKGIKFAENLVNVHKNITEYECEHNKGIFEGNILRKYLEQFGEEQGIEEFYKNYKLLKIVDNIPEFKLPELREVKIEEKISDEIKF